MAKPPLGIVNHYGRNAFQTEAFKCLCDFVGQQVMKEVGVLIVEKPLRLLEGGGVVRVVENGADKLDHIAAV